MGTQLESSRPAKGVGQHATELRQFKTSNVQRIMAGLSLENVDNRQLGLEDLFELIEAMDEVSVHYKSIGVALRVKYAELENIEAKHHYHDVKGGLTAVLEQWLKSNYTKKATDNPSYPSWHKVVEVVAKSWAGNNQALAMEIADNHKMGASRQTRRAGMREVNTITREETSVPSKEVFLPPSQMATQSSEYVAPPPCGRPHPLSSHTQPGHQQPYSNLARARNDTERDFTSQAASGVPSNQTAEPPLQSMSHTQYPPQGVPTQRVLPTSPPAVPGPGDELVRVNAPPRQAEVSAGRQPTEEGGDGRQLLITPKTTFRRNDHGTTPPSEQMEHSPSEERLDLPNQPSLSQSSTQAPSSELNRSSSAPRSASQSRLKKGGTRHKDLESQQLMGQSHTVDQTTSPSTVIRQLPPPSEQQDPAHPQPNPQTHPQDQLSPALQTAHQFPPVCLSHDPRAPVPPTQTEPATVQGATNQQAPYQPPLTSEGSQSYIEANQPAGYFVGQHPRATAAVNPLPATGYPAQPHPPQPHPPQNMAAMYYLPRGYAPMPYPYPYYPVNWQPPPNIAAQGGSRVYPYLQTAPPHQNLPPGLPPQAVPPGFSNVPPDPPQPQAAGFSQPIVHNPQTTPTNVLSGAMLETNESENEEIGTPKEATSRDKGSLVRESVLEFELVSQTAMTDMGTQLLDGTKAHLHLPFSRDCKFKKIPIRHSRFHQPIEPARPEEGAKKPENTYDMTKSQHGFAVIINNKNFKSHSRRDGTIVDGNNLILAFKYLGYIVEVFNDLSAANVKCVFDEISHRDHSEFDSFVCCILSHGSDNVVIGSDSEPVVIKDLTSKLSAGLCPSLGGKPKLFFIQACRGLERSSGVQVDGDSADGPAELDLLPDDDFPSRGDNPAVTDAGVSAVADFFMAYSTSPDYVSFRDPHYGSWYIGELCHALCSLSTCRPLSDIMNTVHENVNKEHASAGWKQAPEFTSRLRKKVFFWP